MATSWKTVATNFDYGDPINWTNNVPDFTSAAFFGSSTITDILDNSGTALNVGEWVFNAGAPSYNFTIRSDGMFITTLTFVGGGIMLNGGSASITVTPTSGLAFINTSSASSANIVDNGTMTLSDFSTLGSASVTIEFAGNKNSRMDFSQQSSAGNATITNDNALFFFDNSSAGNAQITNNTNPSHSYTMEFFGHSSADNATIVNYAVLDFFETSTAGNAIIDTLAGGITLLLRSKAKPQEDAEAV